VGDNPNVDYIETKDTLNIPYYNENGLTEKLEAFWQDNCKTIFKYNSSNDKIFKNLIQAVNM